MHLSCWFEGILCAARARQAEPVMHHRGSSINASSSSLSRSDFPVVGLLDEVPDPLPVIVNAAAKCPHAWVYSSVRWHKPGLFHHPILPSLCSQVWMRLVIYLFCAAYQWIVVITKWTQVMQNHTHPVVKYVVSMQLYSVCWHAVQNIILSLQTHTWLMSHPGNPGLQLTNV